MKKRRIAFISIVILLTFVATFLLSGCSLLKMSLPEPMLSYDNGVVSWNEVAFVSGYEVSLYSDEDGEQGDALGEKVTVTSTKYALSDDGFFWVGVKAISGNALLKDSVEALIRVEKKNTEEDVTVPGGDDDRDDPDDKPVDPPAPGEDVMPAGTPSFDLPVGAEQSFNYLAKDSDGGISVPLTKNTGRVTEIYVTGAELTSGWSYDQANGAIDFEGELFESVPSGTDIAFVAYTEDGTVFEFYVTTCSSGTVVANVDLPSYGAYIYCKNSQSAQDGLTVGFTASASVQAVSVDGRKIANSTTNYLASSSEINFREKYLKSLDYGLHRAELFTTVGIIDFYVFVYSSSIMCYDLSYEFDAQYPDVLLTWKVDYPVDAFEVILNGVSYSSSEYPERFDGNSFDLTGLMGSASTCSACVKSYVNGIDTPATSATAAYADNTAQLKDYLDYSKGFTYLGEEYNRYVDSPEEMDVLAYYMILYNYELDTTSFNTTSGAKTMSYMDVYLNPSLGVSSSSSAMSLFADACSGYKESIKYNYAAVKLSDGAYRLGISMTSKNEALYDSTTRYSESSSNEFHLYISARQSGFEDFAINAREGVSVSTSDQLFFAIEAGYRPLPVEGSVAEKLYELAKDVCRTYIDDGMTDYEKVHTIYDWLGKNVIYDYNIVSEMAGIEPSDAAYNKFYSYDSFYLEGVLENGVAVCNGIAKTFVVLCGIEGITALKVNGQASGGAHAWNKVLINGKWYIVDSTWSNRKASGYKETFSHEYLFMTTSQSASDRTEQTADTIDFYCGDRLLEFSY